MIYKIIIFIVQKDWVRNIKIRKINFDQLHLQLIDKKLLGFIMIINQVQFFTVTVTDKTI